MLGPPGSGGVRANRPVRRKMQESTEDLIRQHGRIPANKKCADCSTKMPQCVNTTVGTYICLTCSGIHRELNMRVKGIAASSFTMEEVERMQSTDNDKVNAMFLAKYNPSVDRMTAPVDNRDEAYLRQWIRRKYQEKAWYKEAAAQATIVAVPPKEPPADLLGFSASPALPPAAAGTNQQWDAFGGSSQQAPAATFVANFGSNTDAFPADFGSTQNQQFANFNAPQQQTAPPPQQQQQQNFANFGHSQQQQFASFGQQQQPPPQQQFGNFGGQPGAQIQQTEPPQQQFTNFGNLPQDTTPQPVAQQQFANFGGQGTTTYPQQTAPPQQQFVTLGSQPTAQQQFGNFGGQPTVPPQQQFGNFGGQPSPQQPGPPQQQFTNFGGLPPGAPTPHAAPPQQQFSNVGGQAVTSQQPALPHQQFTNFAGLPPGGPHQQTAPPQQQFANFGGQPAAPPQAAIPPQQQYTNVGNQQPPQQQHVASVEVQHLPSQPVQQQQFGAFPSPQNPPQTLPPGQFGGQQGMTQPMNTAGQTMTQQPMSVGPTPNGPTMPTQPQVTPHQLPGMQQGAGWGGDAGGRASVIEDAFANMSTGAAAKVVEEEIVKGPKQEVSKYQAGEIVTYRNSNGETLVCTILKVHFDHELDSFYTITLPDGREKQTDDCHLSPGGDSVSSQITDMLSGFSPQQLVEILAFLTKLKSETGAMTQPIASLATTSVPGPTAMPSTTNSTSASNGHAPNMPCAPPLSATGFMAGAMNGIPTATLSPGQPPIQSMPSVPPPLPPGDMSSHGTMLAPPSQMQGPTQMMQQPNGDGGIPSPTPTNNVSVQQMLQQGGAPVPPIYQPEPQVMAPQMNQQQQQQYMQHQQYMQQQQQPPPQQQQQYMQQAPQPQQYMQQQQLPLGPGAPPSPKGNPFDMY